MHLATVPILNSMELFFPKSAQKQLMGKIAVKARNMILLVIFHISINNLFGKIVKGIFNLSFLGFMNFHTTIFWEQFHHAPSLRFFMHLATVPILNSMEPFPKSSRKQLAKMRTTLKIPGMNIYESWIFCWFLGNLWSSFLQKDFKAWWFQVYWWHERSVWLKC